MNLSTFEKKDSTGICFIGERPFPSFLENYINDRPGKIVCDKGNEIGSHRGLSFYTLGQRQGLGIGGLKNYDERPWYVLEKNLLENSKPSKDISDRSDVPTSEYMPKTDISDPQYFHKVVDCQWAH